MDNSCDNNLLIELRSDLSDQVKVVADIVGVSPRAFVEEAVAMAINARVNLPEWQAQLERYQLKFNITLDRLKKRKEGQIDANQ